MGVGTRAVGGGRVLREGAGPSGDASLGARGRGAARRHEDGNETLSSVLDKLAVSEDAETKLAESAYGEAMSDILLRQAVGIDAIEGERE